MVYKHEGICRICWSTQNILIVVMSYFNLCNCTCNVDNILVAINCNAHALLVQEPYKH